MSAHLGKISGRPKLPESRPPGNFASEVSTIAFGSAQTSHRQVGCLFYNCAT